MKKIILLKAIWHAPSCAWLAGLPLVVACGALAGVLYFFSQVTK